MEATNDTRLNVKSGTTLSLGSAQMVFRVTGEDTGGAYAVLEYIGEQGAGSTRHLHRNEDESFYILDGAMTFRLEGRTVRAGPGEFVSIPRELPHSFENAEQVPVRCMIILRPAGLEGFFVEIDALAREYPQGAPGEMVQALLDRYGLDFQPS
jgi:quercetin dioxygenase-like cupin family protein